MDQVRGLASRYCEIVLSGIDLGRWGREAGSRMRLPDLIRVLLAETDVARLRLSSVEPMDFSDDLLGLMAESPRIAHHVHAPLQSGCDRTPRRMHRKYRPRHYADRLPKAEPGCRCRHRRRCDGGLSGRRAPPNSKRAAGSSKECPSRICTYSRIRSAPEQPDRRGCRRRADGRSKERNRVLRDLAAAKNSAFRERMVGRTLSAVTLHEPRTALSNNYLKITLADCRGAEYDFRCSDRRNWRRRFDRNGTIALHHMV